MNDQQVHELFWAAVCLGSAVPLTVFAAIGARLGGRRTEVRSVGAVVAWWGGLSFLVSAVAASEESGVLLGVAADSLTAVPVTFTIAYACAMQARRYAGARDRPVLRSWFSSTRSFPLLFGILFATSAFNAVYPYPIADDFAPAPLRALAFQGPLMAVQCVFALTAAFVFFEAITTRLPEPRPNIQNASAAVLMTGFGVEAALRTALLGARVWGSASQIGFMATTFLAIVDVVMVVELLSAVIALGAYYSRSAVSQLSGRLLDFFDLGRQIEEAFNNVPIHRPGVSGPYEYLQQAATDDSLGLTHQEAQKASEAYCLALLWHCDGITGYDGKRVGYNRFLHLLRVYEQDLRDPDIAEQTPVKRRAETHSLYEVYRVIEPLLTLRGADHSASWLFTERWAQLAYVAATDAGLLSTRALGISVLPKVRRAYELGKRKVWYEAMS